MCLIVQNRKPFQSAILKKTGTTFDKTDINNFLFPIFLDEIDEHELYDYIPRLVKKYESQDYKELPREELEDRKEWTDLEILILLRFYKKHWSIEIPGEEDFFPAFTFTYNIEPLNTLILKMIGQAYDKIQNDITRDELIENKTWSALEVTYLLHYFVIIRPDYFKQEE
jgi:hypothetical protein